ncbi:unnamed protein product [Timema podura]|uniref:Uncharacterized protein n=1 Tax=Timema podura TaxID=61482 RepID=A0ABN7NWI4_TIMPD|nr:unnamed protein product [Timema podura]
MALSVLPNNPMNFTENQHGNAVLEKLKTQKEQGRFCDVTLYVEGKQFKAHRNILASCSPYFDSVFKMHKTVKERLTITCQNSDIFSCLLNYMYTGTVVIDKNNVAELLRLANHFLVLKLKSYCAEYLDRYLDVTNCLSVREMAEKYNMPALSKAATLFVQVHLNKIINQDELLNSPLSKIEVFLSEKSWTVPQNALLSLIAQWISRDINSRERSMRTLLTFVDWNTLDGAMISEHVDREPLYSSSEISLYFILQALVDNNLLFPKYQGIYQALQDKFIQGGFSLDSDSFLNMAVSTAIEGFNDHTGGNTVHQQSLGNNQFLQSTQKSNPNCDNTSASSEEQKICKTESHTSLVTVKTTKKTLERSRRRKEKLLRLRPMARLAALKVALISRHKKKLKIRETSFQGSDDENSEMMDGYGCHLCPHVSPDTTRLEQHLAEVHSMDVTYKCGDYTCERIGQVLTHRMKHSDERPHHCDQCGYSCRTKQNLLAHLRCHTTDRPFKYLYVRHERIHLEEKPFKCSQCEYASSRRDKLKEHFGRHHGENASAKVPYKARPMRGTGSNSSSSSSGRTNGHKTCQVTWTKKVVGLVVPTTFLAETDPLTLIMPISLFLTAGGYMASLMMQHHPPSTTNNPLPSHSQPPAYPGYPPSLDYSHHKSDHQALLHQQASHHMLPSAVRTSQQAVAAMMLDPRFHHPNPGAYHPAPPVSMAAMVAQSGANQGQNVGAQHHQGEYPCMPLF